MRFIAFILSVLILAFSCLPCDDVALVFGSHDKNSQEQQGYPCHHSDTEMEDTCSPFCHCACCSILSIVNPPITVPDFFEVNYLNDYSSLDFARIIDISLPVWQPPQLFS